jgi:hypothetical protein
VSTLRLKLFGGGAIALMLALVVMACGGGSASSQPTSGYKPEVKLVCVAVPCVAYAPRGISHGTYYAEETNFPPYTPVVITATYPNHKPYPPDQYSHPGELFGVRGNVETTDEYGQLPEFGWEARNSDGSVDPEGVYRLTFRFKWHGEIVAAHATAVMGNVP